MVALLAGGGRRLAATTELSGAVIAPGVMVVDTNVKKVQHPTGGVVGELRVRDGDQVKAGDVVVRLDETVTQANLAIVVNGLTELWARQGRLEAERDGAKTITFLPEFCAQSGSGGGPGDGGRAGAVRDPPQGPGRTKGPAQGADRPAQGADQRPRRSDPRPKSAKSS